MRSKKLPDADRDRLKERILGKEYELSLVFIDAKLSRKLNRIYRGKNKPTNVLAFPLSKNSGEIFIDLDTAKIDSKNFDMKPEKFVKFLYIHALLHLKGMRHGAKMNRLEHKILDGTPNRNGH